MIFSDQREQLRQLFFSTWQAYQNKQPLDFLQQQIVEVILQHPEYHKILDKPDKYLDKDYSALQGETNPFLHLALHISIREQISTDRPHGIAAEYRRLCLLRDPHDVEHEMATILTEFLWQAQQTQTAPDENAYLQQIKKL